MVRIERRLVRGRGALTVTATPREAWVEKDGKRLAEGTPVTLEDLPAGRVELTLGAAGYLPLSVGVEIPKGGLTRVERKLERQPSRATGDVEGTRRRAEQGNASAQYKFGDMYYYGRGVGQDFAEAVRWYRKVAEQGHAHGQYNLGFMYYYGRGVGKDFAEAVRWYRKAAEQGYAGGQNNLGFMYEKGRGVGQDFAEAVRWYRKAAEQGYARARRNLKRLKR